MTDSTPDPELLREVASALRWAAHGGAEKVERPRSAAVAASATAAPAQTASTGGRLRLRERPRFDDPSPVQTPDALDAVRARVGDCTRCSLHAGRSQIVFGAGPAPARLMIIGTGPGVAEDSAGALWQGETGKLLDKMLGAMGLRRAEVYLASLVMCRLPEGGQPGSDALKSCTPFLRSQLVAVQPEVVLILGEPAARFLSRKDGPIAELRGRWWQLVDRHAIASHDLEQVLAQPALKRESWADLQQVMARLGLRRH